ncbi:MAG TPA: DUF63 family protein, partial [Candidatus Norongarragalinales archaeon]|nr:DUF63 family protein [Candidatus Norongarragalinales archaeon]
LLAVIYKVSKESAKGDSALMLRKVRDSGIGIAAVMLAILALNGISRVAISHILQLAGILLLAGLGLLAFELIKSRIYNKRETPEFKNLERTTVLSQALDGAATFIGVAFGGYSEQHVVANTLFGFFGSPFAFYLVKLVFALAIVFALRREAESPSEHVYVLALITIFGLAPGTRDALRLFFSV